MEQILKACVSGNHIMTNEIKTAFVRGENIPATINFIIHDNSLPEFCYLMYQRPGDTAPYIVSLTKRILCIINDDGTDAFDSAAEARDASNPYLKYFIAGNFKLKISTICTIHAKFKQYNFLGQII